MAMPAKTPFKQRPKSKTPAERAVEFDAIQAQLRADAAQRRQTAAPSAPARSKRKG